MTTLWICLDNDELTAAHIAAIEELAPHVTIAIGRDPASAVAANRIPHKALQALPG